MTVHVLHAGNGYEYLTRQVAHGDVGRDRGQQLADYYTAKGAPPGVWMGSGIAALGVEGSVSEAQMKALFGEGLHPDAERLIQERMDAGDSAAAAVRAAQLGRRFPTFDTSREEEWRKALTDRLERRSAEQGIDSRDAGRELRATVRREVGLEFFVRDRGREPADEAELKQHIARVSKPTPQPVAGYDLVFTPAKSVSILWALAPDAEARRRVEAAHHRAIQAALKELESEVAFTRSGKAGIRQIETNGIVAAAFDHYDSRAGDPNLHTHVTVSNKVQGVDGKWRTLDGRMIYAAGVTLSERYNSAIEAELSNDLGFVFEDRITGPEKRPVREVVGVPQELIDAFSSRRNEIEDRYDELRAQYRREHGHEPSKAVQHQLAQQATLDTRAPKEALESLADKVDRWRPQAAEYVGLEYAAGELFRGAQTESPARGPEQPPSVEELACRVVDRVSEDRARWKIWHLVSQAEREVHAAFPGVAPEAQKELLDQVVEVAVRAESTSLEVPDEPVPAELQRSTGQSVYRQHRGGWYSSPAVLRAEDRLLDAARTKVAPVVDAEILDAISATRSTSLDAGQRDLVRHFATSEELVAVGVGPAGSGKSTAMAELAAIVTATGHRVVAAAPSAVAAQELGDKIGAPATTIAKLLHTARHQGAEATGLRAGDMLLVDEAGMASTRDLDQLVALASMQGCVVRLLGDPSQLSAVEAGGAFRLLVNRTPAAELTTLHRFRDPEEAAASLLVRQGDTGGLDFYEDAQRLHSGSRDGVLEQLYADWKQDRAEGRSSIMIASDTDTVRELSTRARLDRIAEGEVSREGRRLHDGTTAGVGDVIVTRRNDRRLATAGGRDFVKNGDLWTVEKVGADGALTVRHAGRGGAPVTLPADYAASAVELGYAVTVHRAQGVTVDNARTLVHDGMAREDYYVAITRGRQENHSYVVTDSVVDVDLHHATTADRLPRHVLEDVLGREGADRSATETIADAQEAAESLARLVPEYEDARGAFSVRNTTVQDSIEEVLGAHAVEQLHDDPAWHALTDRMAALVDEGRDPAAVLRAAVDQGPLDDAESVAAVLTWRINEGASRGALDEWVDVGASLSEPSGSGGEAPAAGSPEGWLANRRAQIADRITAVTDRAIAEQPEWLVNAVGPAPEENSPAAQTYRDAVRAAAAYRDRYGVHDSRNPVGHEPTEGRQVRDWRRAVDRLRVAREAIATERPEAGRAPETSASSADRLRALRERSAQVRDRAAQPARRDQADQATRASEERRRREEQERRRQEQERGRGNGLGL